MKTFLKTFNLALFALLILQGAALAASIEGQVTALNREANSITVNQTKAFTGRVEPVNVAIRQDAEFKNGIASLNELEVGDMVKIDAEEKNGVFEAKSIELQDDQAGQQQPQSADYNSQANQAQPAGADMQATGEGRNY